MSSNSANKLSEQELREIAYALRQALSAIDECYAATGHVRVAGNSMERRRIERAVARVDGCLAAALPRDGLAGRLARALAAMAVGPDWRSPQYADLLAEARAHGLLDEPSTKSAAASLRGATEG